MLRGISEPHGSRSLNKCPLQDAANLALAPAGANSLSLQRHWCAEANEVMTGAINVSAELGGHAFTKVCSRSDGGSAHCVRPGQSAAHFPLAVHIK